MIRNDVLERLPWVARNLYEAFEAGRHIALTDLRQTATLTVMLPWLYAEVERTRALLGEDYWPYGMKANRHVLETVIRYTYEQGLIQQPFRVEDVFASSNFEEFVI